MHMQSHFFAQGLRRPSSAAITEAVSWNKNQLKREVVSQIPRCLLVLVNVIGDAYARCSLCDIDICGFCKSGCGKGNNFGVQYILTFLLHEVGNYAIVLNGLELLLLVQTQPLWSCLP